MLTTYIPEQRNCLSRPQERTHASVSYVQDSAMDTSKRPNRNLSHNDPATSMLQREKYNGTLEIELTDMNPTTSIRSAGNVVRHLVLLYRDRKTKRGPTRKLPNIGKRLWRCTRTCFVRNPRRQQFRKPTYDRINRLQILSLMMTCRATELSHQAPRKHTWITRSTKMDVLGVLQCVNRLVLIAQLSPCASHFQQDVPARNAQVEVN